MWTGVCLTFVFTALLEFALVNYASRSDAHREKMKKQQHRHWEQQHEQHQQQQHQALDQQQQPAEERANDRNSFAMVNLISNLIRGVRRCLMSTFLGA